MNDTPHVEIAPHAPECAKWAVWYGREVEGFRKGALTLFIRTMPCSGWSGEMFMQMCMERAHTALGKCRIADVWFCHEFLEHQSLQVVSDCVRWCAKQRLRVSLEVSVSPSSYSLKNQLLAASKARQIYSGQEFAHPTEMLTVFYKLGNVMPNDVIGIGPSYNEKFLLAAEAETKVCPEQYAADVCVYPSNMIM